MAIDSSAKVNFPMTRTIKAAVLLMCFLVCAVAALFSPKDTAKDTETRTQLVPVNNQQSHRGIWLRV
jgi:hypothetical protein